MKEARALIRIGMLLGILVAVLGCSSKEEKVASFISRGDRLLAAGDPVRAIIEYKNARQIDIKNIPATLGLAKAYLAQQDYQKAYGAFQGALELDAGCDEARIWAARLLTMANQGQPAMDELGKVTHSEAYHPMIDIVTARALIILERHREAIDMLSNAGGGESDKEVQMLLAVSLKATKSFDSMEQTVARWRSLDFKNPSSYLFMALYRSERGDTAGASAELQKMVDAKPEDESLRLVQAESLEKLGLEKEAEAAYEALPGGKDNMSAKADFQIRRGDLTKACGILETLIDINPADAELVIKLAQLYLEKNEPAKASELLERTLKQDLKKADREKTLLAKATLDARQGDQSAAKNICNGVLKENQASTDAHMLLGKIMLSGLKANEAEVHLNQVAASRPNNEEAVALLSKSQFLNKNESIAADTLKRSLESNPKSTKLRLELVRLHAGRKDFDQAVKLLDKGLELEPGDLMLLKTRGEFEASRSNTTKAEKDFRKIIELRPDLPLGYMEMGGLMLAGTRYEEAIGWFQQAMEKDRGWTAIPAIVQTYAAKGDLEGALKLARSEAEKKPDSPAAQFLLGKVLEGAGDDNGALKAYDTTANLAPERQEPCHGIAGIYLKQDKIASAIAQIEERYKKEPTGATRMQLATLYEYGERYEDAIRIYNELMEISGKTPELLNSLAYLYAQHTKSPELLAKASGFATQMLAQQPENHLFLDTAAWVAYRRGDLDSAWNYIQEALRNVSDAGIHTLHAAIIANERGDRKQAMELVTRAMKQGLDKKSWEEASALIQKWATAG